MIDQMTGNELWVHKSDIVKSELNNKTLSLDLDSGSNVILKITKFAYTSNNTTYAVTGDYIGYWKFFPITNLEFGIIPAWGFGEVIKSETEDIQEGERFYGFFPMGEHLVVNAGKINSTGFIDTTNHRSELPVIYNHYIRCKDDLLYSKDTEDLQLLFRPLFTTSYLINHMFQANQYYNSQQIILTSASSKTALGLAHCLQATSDDNGPKLIGLTSERNLNFVRDSGYYNKVLSYNQLDQLEKIKSSVVDFSGNHDLQANLQQLFGDNLMYNCLVGMVHWGDRKGEKEQIKKGIFFFAPTYARALMHQVGSEKFYADMASHFLSFITNSKAWLVIKHHNFKSDIISLHTNITLGNLSPNEGHIVKI